jgi:hypothetical protein
MDATAHMSSILDVEKASLNRLKEVFLWQKYGNPGYGIAG